MLKKSYNIYTRKIFSRKRLFRFIVFIAFLGVLESCTLLKTKNKKKESTKNEFSKNFNAIDETNEKDNIDNLGINETERETAIIPFYENEVEKNLEEPILEEGSTSEEQNIPDSYGKEIVESTQKNKESLPSSDSENIEEATIKNESNVEDLAVKEKIENQPANESIDAPLIEESGKTNNNDNKVSEEEKKEPIKYNIEYFSDTMYFDINKGKVQMTGNSNVNYGPNKLEAHKIGINWKKNILTAEAKYTDGKVVTKDKFLILLDSREYYASLLKLNFESQLAYIKNLFTVIEGAILRANKLKKGYEDTLYSDNMSITTCNLPIPHYAIRGKKVIVNGQETICADEVSMEFSSIPTIRSFFGLLFIPDKKNGIIPPSYGGSGDNTNKGFHIKKFGYYWNFNDKVDLSLTSDAHTGGSLALEGESFYKERYRYGGDIMYRIQNSVTKENNFKKMWKFKWNHNSENNTYNSFFAKVDLENEEYSRHEANKGVSQNATQVSSIKYTTRFKDVRLYSIGIKTEYSRNKSAEKTSLVLPSLVFYTPSIYIFNQKNNRDSWFSDLNFKHSIEYRNTITTKRDYLDFFEPKDWASLYDKKKYGIKNFIPLECNIPIGYFNFIPRFEYSERWYWERYDRSKGGKILESGFHRVWEAQPSLELNTTAYGTLLYSKNKKVEAIRHQLDPSLVLTYDHGYPNYWQEIDGKFLNRFEDFVFDTPDHKKKLILDGKLCNRFDIKLKEKEENGINIKAPILESCDISSSYDFLEKDFPVGDLKLKASTSLFKKVIYIEGSQNYDQYYYSLDEDEIYNREKKLAISNKQGLGHLKEGKLTISMNVNSRTIQGEPDQMEMLIDMIRKKAAAENPEAAAQEYVNFNIPWVLEIKYDYTYKSPIPNEIDRSKILSTDLKLSISEKWVLGMLSGYDFSRGSIVRDNTRVSVFRDLHCWQFTFSWLPISKTQYFDFSIGVKAPILKTVEYTRKDKRYTNV